MVTEDQKEMLEEKFENIKEQQPQMKKLREKLLGVGGVEIVAIYEEDIDLLLEEGKLFEKSVSTVDMENSNCHSNVAYLYSEEKCDEICTGWALSEDQLWRQHSWALSNGRILETTEKRKKYYGVVLKNDRRKDFISFNYFA